MHVRIVWWRIWSKNLSNRWCVNPSHIIGAMSLVEQIQKDITAAMKAREEQRLSTLRMVKTALQESRDRKNGAAR